LESGQHAKRWYAEFNDQVIAEARRLGLVADRGGWPLLALLRLALLVPAVLAAVVAVRGDGGWTLVMYIFFGYAAATLPVRLLHRVVPRHAGTAVAARCRAMRAELSHYPVGGNAPPGDRRRGLSFGASPMVALIGFVPALLFSGIWGIFLGRLTP
jgi:hypothetical protein